MPIRPENKDRYPKDWPQIRERILYRASDQCEKCGVPNHSWITRHADGTWSQGVHQEQGSVMIVLTIAHLDHTPENCADYNLRAWCQKCHNAYDAPMRAAGIKARAKSKLAVGDLFP